MNAFRNEARIALAVARKDALSELRGRHATVSTLFFAAIVLLLFGFALGPDAARLAAAAPGLLWLAVVFAGLLAVSRLHLLETDDGALEQLALYPVSRRAIYAGKALGGFGVMLLLGVVVLVGGGVLFAWTSAARGRLLLATVVLGALGVAAVGTFYAGITVRLRAREVMLPLLDAAGAGAAAAGRGEGNRCRAGRRPVRRARRVAPAAARVRRPDAGRRRGDLRLPAGGRMKTRILGLVALLAVAVAMFVALFVVPADLNQGDAQRIMYPHVASAWLAYLSFGVTALAGIGWLWKRDLRFDAIAVAGAEIGCMFTAFAIWGGMMWGRPIWGVFWQWEDPQAHDDRAPAGALRRLPAAAPADR